MTKVTISDVAKEAGVSTMTVSRVLNGKGELRADTRKRVMRAIEKLNYRPSAIARSLATRRTRTIGLTVPDITNPFFPEIVRGAEEAAWQAGYTIVLSNTVEDLERETAAIERLEDNRVDGVILCSARLPMDRLLPLLKHHSNAVLVNRAAPSEAIGTVQIDDTYGTMRAVHHLLASGHSKIGLLAGPPASQSAAKRLRGFIDAHETTGQQVDTSRIEPCFPNEDGGVRAAKALLERHPRLEALVCYNDLVAVGALQACAELGINVPDDLAIIGCDDIRLASLVRPALTTLRADKRQLGERAVTMLIDMLAGRSQPQTVIIKPELIVRQSAP